MRREPSAVPIRHDIVLVGGGHTHVQVMTAFGMRPEPGVRLTLVTDRLTTPYSGMLPGHIAGVYSHDEMHIDLARLARATRTRLIHAEATGLDRAGRQLRLRDRPPLAYDTLSLNLGITPDLSSIAGAAEHGIAVKPISSFLGRLESMLARAAVADGPRRFAVVGGGAAGVEIAFALRTRLDAIARLIGQAPEVFAITLVSGGALVPTLNDGVRRRVRQALTRRSIAVLTGFKAVALDDAYLTADDGQSLAVDAALFSTVARAPDWLCSTDLSLAADGSVRTKVTLQVEDEEAIFAVGDCATVIGNLRPKAGVFAVRQGPALARNLRARAQGQPLAAYRAQHRYLVILMTGDGEAIAGRGSWFSVQGALVWRWKDWIDRRFMAMFSGFGQEMAQPATPAELEAGTAMRCGGCAAKVGPAPLGRALRRLPPAPGPRDRLLVGLDEPDDAAVVEVAPGLAQIETIDQIRAFVDDPWLFGRIAALHALNDVLAMGGEPTRALAIATVPHAAPAIVEADLFQLLAGARHTLDAHDVALTGGHSSEGEALALGFAVTGRAAPGAILRKGGAKAGDRLVLVKPIGAGLIMAADMRGAVRAEVSEAAIASMLLSNAQAAAILAPIAHAMTDVTGFGLAGHLIEMLRPPGLSAAIDLAAVPLLPGALELAKAGYRSSLTVQNEVLKDALAGSLSPVDLALLFDPQTSGGLLAAVPEQAAAGLVASLWTKGYAAAAMIGAVGPKQPGPPIFCKSEFADAHQPL
ncbi:MAG: selenide, water dikinase SelD [Beijerinckiaceae bacterium]|nr:selenide, water dikinase SelD [Beijerinckiaceae bacterium]